MSMNLSVGTELAYAESSSSYISLAQKQVGDQVSFAGKEWVILDPEKGFLILKDVCDEKVAWGNKNYKQSTIRRYINGKFLNSLSYYKNFIEDTTWDCSNYWSTNVTDKVGLLPWDEYCKCHTYLPAASKDWFVLALYREQGYDDCAAVIYPNHANGGYSLDRPCGVRPVLYLKSGFKVSNEGQVLTPPLVSTVALIRAISPTTAEVKGVVDLDGGDAVIESGIVFSEEINPVLTDYKVKAGQGDGEFIAKLSGLKENTIYHVRAYATNGVGSSYGEDVSFKTAPDSVTVSGSIPILTVGEEESYDLSGLSLTASDVFGNSYDLIGQAVTWEISSGDDYASLEGSILKPVSGGSGTITATVKDLSTAPVSFEINPRITIKTGSLPKGIIGVRYYTCLKAIGGTPPYTWYWCELPSGLEISGLTGEILGTPSESGVFDVNISVHDGEERQASKSYKLTIGQSVSIDLDDLKVSSGYLSPLFDHNTVAYQLSGVDKLESIDITAQVTNPASTFTINGKKAQSGVAETVYLEQGANLIPVVVNAPGGRLIHTQKAYIISVNGTVSNADLESLTLSEGSIDFNAGRTEYSLNVGNENTKLDVSAISDDDKALVLINGSIQPVGESKNIDLKVGTNEIEIMVVAQDASTKTYTLKVIREAGNTQLSGLTLSEGSLSPDFTSDINEYLAQVPNSASSLTINPVLADPDASVSVNGNDPSEPVKLEPGENTIMIVVKGNDGVTSKSYTLKITQEEALEIGTEKLFTGIVNRDYEAILSARGGAVPYTWQLSGDLPEGLEFDAASGKISGTPAAELDKIIGFTVSDSNGLSSSKSIRLKIKLGCGNGGYIITPDNDPTYSTGLTADGITTMTVNEGFNGFKYFSVAIEPVAGHTGNEAAVFVQLRDNKQIALSALRADFDTISEAQTAFNVRAGDVVKTYIVDKLSTDPELNPSIL